MGGGLHTKTLQDRSAGCGHLLGARAMSKGEEAGSHLLAVFRDRLIVGSPAPRTQPPHGRPQKTPVTDRRGRASPGQAACSRLCPFAPCTSRARSAGGRHAPRGRGCGARPTSWGVTPRGRETRVSTRWLCSPVPGVPSAQESALHVGGTWRTCGERRGRGGHAAGQLAPVL